LKIHAKYVCTQDLILCFKRDIDKNYVVVKRFPTLSNWVYFSLRRVNSIRRDNTAKILFFKDRQRQVCLLLYDWQKRDLYVSLPVICGKNIIYNMTFKTFLVIMASMITCLGLLSRHLQSLWALKGSTTLFEILDQANRNIARGSQSPLNFPLPHRRNWPRSYD
jgi:hypothetical protein